MTTRLSYSAAIALLAVVFTVACTVGDSIQSLPPATVEGTTFATSLGVDLTKSTRTSNGDYIRDLVVGTGALISTGDSISVKYTGWLANGTQFDSNISLSTTYGVKLGAGRVIPGWEEGIPGMHVGGTRQILVPPALAYGYYTVGPIPSNSVLAFSVQVVGNP